MKAEEIRPGMMFSSETAPENWMRVEALNEDGSFMVSFPNKPEYGLATIDQAYWAELQEKHRITFSPLAL